MPTTTREKFSSQAAPEVLAALGKIVESEECSIQAVLDDTLREYIERKEKGQPRRQAMDTLAQTLSEFDQFYRELAK